MARETDRLLSIGVALSAERNISQLHEMIVRNARELTRADSGSLFLLETTTAAKRSCASRSRRPAPKDAGTHLGAVLPLSRARSRATSRSPAKSYASPTPTRSPKRPSTSFNPSFDKQNGYRTKSVLVVPMRDHENAIVGVIMLINRKPTFDLVLDVARDDEERRRAVQRARRERACSRWPRKPASRWKTRRCWHSIQDLFEQFVRASVKAIEVRDKSTQGHSSRVAELTVAQALAANAVEAGRFARAALRRGRAARDALRRAAARFREGRRSRIHLRQSQEAARRQARRDPLALSAGDQPDRDAGRAAQVRRCCNRAASSTIPRCSRSKPTRPRASANCKRC